MAQQPRPGITPPGEDESGDLGQARGRELTVRHNHQIITARRVEKPRSIIEVRQALSEAAAINADRYIYSWEAKNRREGTKTLIEGLTIKAANDLFRIWGNDYNEVLVAETEDAYVFSVCMYDLERGTGYTRLFRQRKRQDTGMADRDRAEDIIFQIGQSKAIRNCVLNALASEASYLLEEAKKGILGWVTDNKEKAWNYIAGQMQEKQIDQSRIEAVFGRRFTEFSIQDLTSLLKRLRSVEEGWISVDDAFPTGEDVATVSEQMEARRATEVKKDAPAQTDGAAPSPPPAQAADKQKPGPKPGAKAAKAAKAAQDATPAPGEQSGGAKAPEPAQDTGAGQNAPQEPARDVSQSPPPASAETPQAGTTAVQEVAAADQPAQPAGGGPAEPESGGATSPDDGAPDPFSWLK